MYVKEAEPSPAGLGITSAHYALPMGGMADFDLVLVVTNTDSIAPQTLLGRLAGMGIQAPADEVLTPVVLAERLLDGLASPRLVAVASPGIRELLGRFLAARGEP